MTLNKLLDTNRMNTIGKRKPKDQVTGKETKVKRIDAVVKVKAPTKSELVLQLKSVQEAYEATSLSPYLSFYWSVLQPMRGSPPPIRRLGHK